jgi:hypothetical protein
MCKKDNIGAKDDGRPKEKMASLSRKYPRVIQGNWRRSSE